MSENWNKKHLHNRLDSMFSDLDDSNNLPGLSIFNQLNGWVWEIDPDGIITKCAPDVDDLLGFKCETLMNQPISDISDFSDHISLLSRKPEDRLDPTKYKLIFYHVNGTKVKTASYIAPRFSPDQSFLGWTGMTLVEEQEINLELVEDINIDESDLPLSLQEILVGEPSPPEITVTVPEQIAPTSENLSIVEAEHLELTGESLQYSSEKPKPEILNILRTIDDDPDRIWQPDEVQLVEQVQTQLELAMENAKLFQQTQLALAETDEQARKLRLLNELTERLSQAGSLIEVYDITAKIAFDIFGAVNTNISIWSDEKLNTLEITAAAGRDAKNQVGKKISQERKQLYQPIEDFRIQIIAESDDFEFPEVRSSIAGPIYASGDKLGVLFVGKDKPNAFDKQDESFMSQLLSILNSVVENRKLFAAIETALATTEEQARRLAELNRLSEMLSQADTIDAVLNSTMQMMDNIIPCKVCQTAIWREDLEVFTVYDLVDGSVIEVDQTGKSQKTLISAVTNQKKLISENELSVSLFDDSRALAESREIRSLIAAPLLSGEKSVGAILVGNTKDFAYTTKDETLLQSISSIMVSTMENRRLFRQIQRRSIQLETSAEVSRIASTILDPSELLPEVVELIKKGFDLYYAGIFLIDNTGEITGEPNKWAVLKAGSGFPGQKMLESAHKLEIGGDSMIGTSIAMAEARIALDVGKETKFFRNPYLPETRSEMALPLISRGQVLGALTIQSNQEGSFTQEDITSLQTMADQLANAIENANLFEQTEARAEELTILNEMARAYTQSLDVDTLIKHTFEFSSRLMNANNFYVALFNQETNTINFKLFVEDGEFIPPPEPKIVMGDGLTDWIIKNKLPVLMQNDVSKQMASMGIKLRGKPAESWLGVPMLIGDEVLGVVAVQSYSEDVHYSDHDLGLLSSVASQTAVAIDNALRFQQTQARAKYEQVMREITTRVHSSTNAETILKTAVREVSSALGRQAYIELNLDPNGNQISPMDFKDRKNQEQDTFDELPEGSTNQNAPES